MAWQALSTWCTLQQRLAARPAPLAPLAACFAVEEAALALPRLVTCASGGLEELEEAGPLTEASHGEAEVCGPHVAFSASYTFRDIQAIYVYFCFAHVTWSTDSYDALLQYVRLSAQNMSKSVRWLSTKCPDFFCQASYMGLYGIVKQTLIVSFANATSQLAIMGVPVQDEEQVRQALDEVASRVAGAAPPGLFQREADSVSTLALQQAALHEVS